MAVNEESRHHLYQSLEETLGHEDATVLMEHLPPVGWADVATKRDLDLRFANLEERLDLRFAAMDARFSVVEGRIANLENGIERIRSEFRTTMLAVMSMMVVLVAAVVAAVKL
jgi:hypothetical protein